MEGRGLKKMDGEDLGGKDRRWEREGNPKLQESTDDAINGGCRVTGEETDLKGEKESLGSPSELEYFEPYVSCS